MSVMTIRIAKICQAIRRCGVIGNTIVTLEDLDRDAIWRSQVNVNLVQTIMRNTEVEFDIRNVSALLVKVQELINVVLDPD